MGENLKKSKSPEEPTFKEIEIPKEYSSEACSPLKENTGEDDENKCETSTSLSTVDSVSKSSIGISNYEVAADDIDEPESQISRNFLPVLSVGESRIEKLKLDRFYDEHKSNYRAGGLKIGEPCKKKSKTIAVSDENDKLPPSSAQIQKKVDVKNNNGKSELVSRTIKTVSVFRGKFNESRDENVRNEEQKGIIEIHLLGNSTTKPIEKKTSLYLLAIHSLFGQQLPEMPSDYVHRIVFDSNHKILALTKKNVPIGAICFQVFPTRSFAEIVFCAVALQEQTKGYGTHLMNHLKHYIMAQGMLDLLTYADCNAIGYFIKQEFSTDIKLARPIYEGSIKEYEKATLMHCELHPNFMNTQSENLKRNFQTGLTCLKNGSVPIDGIPCLKERMSKQKPHRLEDDPKKLTKVLTTVWQAVRRQKSAWPFLHSVSSRLVPDLSNIIMYPMDLKIIGDRLKRSYYKTRRSFIADMARMFENYRLYNSDQTGLADDLERFFEAKMRELGLWDD